MRLTSRVAEQLMKTLKLFDDFKNKQKSVRSNGFWYIKVCIFWKCIQCTVHWHTSQMSEKFPSDKINGTKNAFFFLSRAPNHHSFTFNLRFLYELKYKVRLSKTAYGIFHFLFRFVFIKVFIFFQQKNIDRLSDWPFNKKATHYFTPRPLIFKLP